MTQSEKLQTVEGGPEFSRTIAGMMRSQTWGVDNAGLLDWIKAVLDMGITTFDHADIYGNYGCEGFFGEALALEPSIRAKMQIVTKCNIGLVASNRPENYIHHYNSSKEHIIASAENSLKQFQTDYIDVLLIHRHDFLMDADVVADAVHTLMRDGKILHVGVSNFPNSLYELLESRLNFPIVTNQLELSIMKMQALTDGTLDLAQKLRVAPMIWSPVAAGKMFRGDDEQARRIQTKLHQLAEKYDARTDQIAMAWVMKHPARAMPVLGTGKLERVQAAVDAESINLDVQDWYALWEASKGHDVP